jgi:hypothetical protein
MAEHPDSDELLNALLPFAHQHLAKNGEFYPIGASMSIGGEITINMVHTGEEFPPSQELIDALKAIFKEKAANREIRACGICYDVRISTKENGRTDAICVDIQHATEGAVRVFQPYRTDPNGSVMYDELSGSLLEPTVFNYGNP